MKRHPRRSFWVDLALAALSIALLVITLMSTEWIENLFSVNPDQGSGALEWSILATSAVIATVFIASAGYEWNRASRRTLAAGVG